MRLRAPEGGNIVAVTYHRLHRDGSGFVDRRRASCWARASRACLASGRLCPTDADAPLPPSSAPQPGGGGPAERGELDDDGAGEAHAAERGGHGAIGAAPARARAHDAGAAKAVRVLPALDDGARAARL